MKEEIKNLKFGTGSRVCSEASTGVGLGSGTFARRPLLSSWRTETWIPRKMETHRGGSQISQRGTFRELLTV